MLKLKLEFLPYAIMGDYLLVPTAGAAFDGLVKGHETFGMITECLRQDTSETEIADRLMETYSGVSREKVERDVHAVIERLSRIGAVEE